MCEYYDQLSTGAWWVNNPVPKRAKMLHNRYEHIHDFQSADSRVHIPYDHKKISSSNITFVDADNTSVINDPLGQTPQSHQLLCFDFVLFCQIYGRTTIANTMIPTGCDFGLADWIKNSWLIKLFCSIVGSVSSCWKANILRFWNRFRFLWSHNFSINLFFFSSAVSKQIK